MNINLITLIRYSFDVCYNHEKEARRTEAFESRMRKFSDLAKSSNPEVVAAMGK